jgi:hypothetical protein
MRIPSISAFQFDVSFFNIGIHVKISVEKTFSFVFCISLPVSLLNGYLSDRIKRNLANVWRKTKPAT